MSRHLCPRICIAITIGLVLGLIPLVYCWKAITVLPRIDTLVPLQKTLTERVTHWRMPTISYVPSPVTLLFVGDIMLDRLVATRSQKAKDPSYPFRRLPERWFESVDYAVANLEGPLTSTRRPPEKSIDFQFDPALATVLKKQGIDAFSQANNHALDQGAVGYEESISRLREAGFLVFGHQVQDGDIALATTTIRGKRFAFVGFNTTDNPLDRDSASSTLLLAKAQADEVMAFMHWGPEYQDHPHENDTQTAEWLIDHGVDIVIGTHPHWVQGIDQYKGRPIIYSLGNFIFDQDFSKETREGLAVKLTFNDKVVNIEPIPLQIDESQPRVLEGEEKEARLKRLRDISSTDLGEQIQQGKIHFERK